MHHESSKVTREHKTKRRASCGYCLFTLVAELYTRCYWIFLNNQAFFTKMNKIAMHGHSHLRALAHIQMSVLCFVRLVMRKTGKHLQTRESW